jgi:hypothetical protein
MYCILVNAGFNLLTRYLAAFILYNLSAYKSMDISSI